MTGATATPCPHPLTRAPRADGGTSRLHERLHLAPRALQGALVAVVCRDFRGAGLDAAQRLSHFPASPMLALSWFRGAPLGLVDPGADGSGRWTAFDAPVLVSGSLSAPTVSWSPGEGYGGIVCFTAEVARALFGIDPGAVLDRFVAADAVLDARWRPLIDALGAADDDAAALAALARHLGPRWHAIGGAGAVPALSRLGRHWVERLAWQAHAWGRTQSPRQVERRVKAYSGRSLRAWQALVKTEGVFEAARARHAAQRPFDWAALAADEGFADQSHLVRAARRVTGFAPGEFAERFVGDASFWLYRLWV